MTFDPQAEKFALVIPTLNEAGNIPTLFQRVQAALAPMNLDYELIVVDDDIGPFDLHDVMWALATRCDPETSLDVCRRIWSCKIDPRLPKHKKEAADYTGAVAVIDAWLSPGYVTK